jgi:acetylornithine/N-succinyldiaminopimelate aminotransferase
MEKIILSTGHEIRFDDIVASDNCYLTDSKGGRLIDLESGVWCTSVGHNNKRVNDVITSQINKIMHTGFCYVHPQLEIAAEKILNITGIWNGKCEFLCSGSEAVEYGMRIARSISKKPLALTFSDSYFGAYGDAAIKDSVRWYIYNWLDCGCDEQGNGCFGECDSFRNIPFDKIGTFLFEPGSSSGLVRFPSQELISKIVREIKSHKGIIIANEITTGIGRTGKWFGYQHYNFTPDIVAIGKGVGNGYPVSVTAVSNSVLEQSGIENFKYAQSHQNDPLGVFVACEVLKIIEDGELLLRCRELGDFLKENLNRLITDNSIVKQIRGRGLMLAIEFRRNARQAYEELLKRGYIVCWRPKTEVLRIDPALTVENEILDSFIDAFGEVIEIVKDC